MKELKLAFGSVRRGGKDFLTQLQKKVLISENEQISYEEFYKFLMSIEEDKEKVLNEVKLKSLLNSSPNSRWSKQALK